VTSQRWQNRPRFDLCHASPLLRSLHQAVITDPLFYFLALPAVILLGLGKGGFAGLGMISVPLLTFSVPTLQGAAILLPILITQDAISVWNYRHDWSAWNLKVLIPGGVLGMVAGTLFASYVSNAAIELAVGIIGVSFVLYRWLNRWLWPHLTPAAEKPRRPHPVLGVFWGALAGFMSLLVNVGAPPYQIHILPQKLDKLTFVGTTVIFFAFLNLMKITPYFLLGQFSSRNFATSAALLPLAVAANYFGIWLVRRTPTEPFYRITYFLMFAISLALIWQGATGIRH
jgi:uncharacterized membrane protein YfcA